MNGRWVGGNLITLLINGEAFFPRVFECIAAAEREILLETFILFEDKVGLALQTALLTAARRGVQVDVTIDGYGSPDLSPAFISTLTASMHFALRCLIACSKRSSSRRCVRSTTRTSSTASYG